MPREIMKNCKDCKTEKDTSEFYFTGGHYSSYCKPCHYIRTHKLVPLEIKNCPVCQKEFIQTDSLQIYCCDKCRSLNWSRKHKDQLIEYYIQNVRKIAKQKFKYYEENKDTILPKLREYQKTNRGLFNALSAKRRAQKLKATPPWLTKDQLEEIKQFYINCPKGYQVDHIVPLLSKVVCGLHVPWNLQYLTAKENRRKGNKIGGDIYA